MKKNVSVILLVALFGSLLLNVCQFVGVGHTEKASPWVGTYICGDEWDGATYIVLTADREYYRYQQFGTPEKADRERCERAMEELGIAHMRRKLCNQISGGELQMVLIARALCAEPKLLVLDEPESNLDFRNQLIILETIRRLSREEGLCCIFNTHYPGHALRISDRALVLSREGTADFGEPSEVITREIMGRVFKVNVDIVDAQYDGMDYQAITAISLCNT